VSDFWDVGQFKKTQSGKNRFVKLGYAKQKDDGGFFVNLDALPLPDEQGRVSIAISPQRQRDDSQQGYSNASQGGDMEDQIPF
jgi:hypothetical protein